MVSLSQTAASPAGSSASSSSSANVRRCSWCWVRISSVMSTPGRYPSAGSLRMHNGGTWASRCWASGDRRETLGARKSRRGGAVRAGRLLPLLTAVLVATSACGFLNDLAHPEVAAPGTPIATATPAPQPEPPPVIADGDLRTSVGAPGDPTGHLTVTLGESRTGLEPPVPDTEACDFDTAALQYLPVEFASTAPGLA